MPTSTPSDETPVPPTGPGVDDPTNPHTEPTTTPTPTGAPLGPEPDDPWSAFLDEAPIVDPEADAAARAELEARLTRHDVTAVVVAHDGARWLRFCLAALADLDRPPRRVVAVDHGSADGSLDLLEESLGAASVLRGPRDAAFGSAVRRAVDALAGAPGLPTGDATGSDAPVVSWLWLLHDDCAPEPDALRQLLVEAERTPSAAVIGPKVRGWRDGRLLLELGVTVGRGGRRETYLERGETDQGQHDHRRDVLAVGSAGMLVRRDAWDELGGFADDLPMFRDDVDFCWRARRAGHRVVVAPEAVVHHAEAAAHGRRDLAAATAGAHGADRRSALLLLLGNLPGRALPWAYVRLVVGSVVRTVALLLGKAPADAAEELGALAAVVGRPDRVAAARRRRREPRREAWSSVAPYLAPTGLHLRHGLEAALGSVGGSGSGAAETAGALESGPVSDEADDLAGPGQGAFLRLLRRPLAWVALGLLLTSLVAWRGLLVGSALQGGALLPAPQGASGLWQRYAEAWHAVGVGSDLAAPPYLAVLAASSAATLGRPGALVPLLLLASVPLAGVTAYLLLGRLTSRRRLRLWGSVTYALLPAVTGAQSGGRLGTAVAAWLLPLLALAALRLRPAADVPPTWRAVGGSALLLALAAAFVPVVWVAALVLAVLFGAAARAERGWWLRVGAMLALPVVLLLPWSWQLVTQPADLLLEPGAQGGAATDPGLPAWAIPLAAPGGPGVPPVWATVGLVVAALGAVLVGRRRRVVGGALAVSAVGLLLGLAAVVVRVEVPSLAATVAPWPGVATLLLGGGLVVAAVVGAGGLRGALRERAFGWRQPAAVGVTGLALLVPVLCGVTWLARGVEGPVTRAPASVLPAFVAAAAETPQRPATLVLTGRSGDPVSFAVLQGTGLRLGDADVAPSAAAAGPLGELVDELASGRAGDDVASRLAAYGAAYVLVTQPVDQQLAAALDTAPGLERLSATDGTALWGVAGAPSRVRVQSSDGETVPVPSGPVGTTAAVPAAALDSETGAVERALSLAVAADPRWRATFDGSALPVLPPGEPPVSDPPVPAYAGPTATWAQRFSLPEGAGEVSVSYDGTTRTRWLVVQGLVLVAVVVLALPGRRRVVDDDGEGDLGSTGAGPTARPVEPLQRAGAQS